MICENRLTVQRQRNCK